MFLLTTTLILTATTKESNETIDNRLHQDANQDFLDNNNNNNNHKQHNLTYAQISILKNESFSFPSGDHVVLFKEKESASKTVNDTVTNTAVEELEENSLGFEESDAGALVYDTESKKTGGKHRQPKIESHSLPKTQRGSDVYLNDTHPNDTNKEKYENKFLKKNLLKLQPESNFTEKTVKIEQREVDDAVEYGLRAMQELVDVKEPLLYQLGLFLDKHHPASKVAIFGAPNQRGVELSKFGYASLEATRKIAEGIPHTVSRESAGLPPSVQSRLILNECPLRGQPRCPPVSKKYRTADGTCNNPKHPWRGAAMLPMLRFLPPVYEDGLQRPRLSVFGNKLPLPRQVSVTIHRDKNREIQTVTLMFTQWGQFVDHDVTSTVKSRGFNGSVPQCCEADGRGFLPSELTHPACLPIEIPQDDWFLSRFGIRCMEFVRSAPSTRINCDLGWREQINQVTPFIDASTIYGSDIDTSDSTRTFRHGKLIYGRPHDQGPLLPPDPPGGELCRAGALTTDCLQAGDGRVGETPGLTALHTVFVRYHNKIATVLSKVNAHWSDERTFQETRRIIGAIVQHVTYNEYLPIVVGPEVMQLFGLNPVKKGYYNGYDAKINPAIANGFATAAFRFGHSMVQNSLVRTDSQHRPLFNNVTLHEELENIENIWSFGSVDRTLLGFCNQPSQRRDEFIADELTNHLFQTPAAFFGMDLAAINVQRGRDHGIAPYTAWREPCGLTPITTWQDLEQVMIRKSVYRFKSIYLHVNDIDLYTGGLAEKPLRGGVVGPTFACIIAQQFLNLRNGDRFWYENGGFDSSFTPAQLQQIRKVSLAQVLCQTMEEIETLQPFVFLSSDSFRNIRVSCDGPAMNIFDLSPWIERLHFDDIDNHIDQVTDTDRLPRAATTGCKKRKIKINPNLRPSKTSTVVSKGTNRQKLTTPKPIKITLTNFTTNTVKVQNKYGGNAIKARPQYYQISDTDHSDVTYLFGIVPDRTTAASKVKQTPLEVNIKIQYYPPSQPTTTSTTTKKYYTDVRKKKPNTTTKRPTDYDNNVVIITKRPTVTTTRPPEYNYPIFLQSPPNNYNYRPDITNYDSVVTTRPYSVIKKRPTFTYDNDNYNRPSYYPDRPTNYDYNYRPNSQNMYGNGYDNIGTNVEDLPLNKPDSYRPNSNHYVYTDVYTTKPVYNNDVTKRPTTYYDVITKRPTYYDDTKRPNYYDNTKRPTYYDDIKRPTDYDNVKRPTYYDETVYTFNKRPVTVVQRPYNRVDSIEQVYSQYFGSQESKVEATPDNNNNNNRQTGNNFDGQHKENIDKAPTKIHVNSHNVHRIISGTDINDKLDFKSRILYKPTSTTDNDDDSDNDNDDDSNNDKDNFVKISSVTVEQASEEREGDVELRDEHNAEAVISEDRGIRIVDIDIAPSEVENNQWVVFNETEGSSSLLPVPELDSNFDFSKEVPKPIKKYSFHHEIEKLSENENQTTMENAQGL